MLTQLYFLSINKNIKCNVAPSCIYVCVCIFLFRYRRIEKVIQRQTLHILSDIYKIGPIKRNIFIG